MGACMTVYTPDIMWIVPAKLYNIYMIVHVYVVSYVVIIIVKEMSYDFVQ